jgi:hypothetical protein
LALFDEPAGVPCPRADVFNSSLGLLAAAQIGAEELPLELRLAVPATILCFLGTIGPL